MNYFFIKNNNIIMEVDSNQIKNNLSQSNISISSFNQTRTEEKTNNNSSNFDKIINSMKEGIKNHIY